MHDTGTHLIMILLLWGCRRSFLFGNKRMVKMMIGLADTAHRHIKLSNKGLQVNSIQMMSYWVIDRSYAINHLREPDRNQR